MRTYNPADVTVSFNGVPIDGFGPDTFIEVSRNEDGWSFQPSLSGGGARSRNPNKSGRATITLLAASPANALLMAIAVADEEGGEGVGELLIKDRSTSAAKVVAQNAWIVKIPDWTRAKEVGTVPWILESDEMTIAHDGLIDA